MKNDISSQITPNDLPPPVLEYAAAVSEKVRHCVERNKLADIDPLERQYNDELLDMVYEPLFSLQGMIEGQAEQSVAAQQQQNIWQARQSEIVAKQSEALAVAVRDLVARDAQARSEILTAQREVRAEAAKLDDERRDLIALRTREPLIAATIQVIGGMVLCLIPLAIAACVLRELHRPELGADLVNEFLLAEVADLPRLTLAVAEPPLLAQPNTPP